VPLDPTDDDVLEVLRAEGRALEREAYPGDLADDVRMRRHSQTRHRFSGRWALATAAAAVIALSALLRDRPDRRTPAPARPSLSPFATVRLTPPGTMPLRLAPPPPRMGPAMNLGAASLSHLRPPSLSGTQIKEER
jgi:hypothetical protein